MLPYVLKEICALALPYSVGMTSEKYGVTMRVPPSSCTA